MLNPHKTLNPLISCGALFARRKRKRWRRKDPRCNLWKKFRKCWLPSIRQCQYRSSHRPTYRRPNQQRGTSQCELRILHSTHVLEINLLHRSDFRESTDGRAIVAKFELPDVAKEDIHVSFQRNKLVITWETGEIHEWDEDGVILREYIRNTHHRTLPLPEGTRVRSMGSTYVFH